MGVPLEFCIREKLMRNPTTEMLGYGSHDVPKGSWSDDTSMTLATIDAILRAIARFEDKQNVAEKCGGNSDTHRHEISIMGLFYICYLWN